MEQGRDNLDLRQFPIFSALTPEEGVSLLAACALRHWERGEVVFREGERGNSLVLLLKGDVAVTRINSTGTTLDLGRAGVGAVMGEMSLLDAAPRSATVTAINEVRALEMQRSVFIHLLEGRQPAASKILQQLSLVLCERLREAVDRAEGELLDEMDAMATLSHTAGIQRTLPPMRGAGPGVTTPPPPDRPEETRRDHLLRVLWG